MNIKDLIEAAAEHGATVEADNEDSSGWNVYQVIAPEGMMWSESGVQMIRVEWLQHGKWKAARDEAIQDAIDRMRFGLEEAS